jgi:hypothetical protein
VKFYFVLGAKHVLIAASSNTYPKEDFFYEKAKNCFVTLAGARDGAFFCTDDRLCGSSGVF